MNALTARREFVKLASQEIGTREIGGNNLGPRVREYQTATWLKPGAWPWCAAFICWCVKEWLEGDPNLAPFLGIKDIDTWRPQTAGAFDFARWGKSRGLPILGEMSSVLEADLIIFDFSHIGIVTADAPAKIRMISTVEGNTNGRGARDSETGDGVWGKIRMRSLAQKFVRLVP